MTEQNKEKPESNAWLSLTELLAIVPIAWWRSWFATLIWQMLAPSFGLPSVTVAQAAVFFSLLLLLSPGFARSHAYSKVGSSEDRISALLFFSAVPPLCYGLARLYFWLF